MPRFCETFRHWSRQVGQSLVPIFTPPFDGLGIVVIFYIIWAHLVFPHNDVLRGNLPDTDDYMYLNQVLDWIQGQSWYDNVQHRLDPPSGTPIHFSRLVQIPLALGVLFFHRLGLPLRGAATVTALIEPFILLGLLLSSMRRLMARLIDPAWAGLSAYVTLFSTALLFEFMPGHVDHHGLVIVLMITVLGYLMRLFDNPADHKIACYAGIILGISLMIALECLPWVLLIGIYLGIWAMIKGGQAARSAAVFGTTYLVTSLLCLAFTRPPAQWMVQDVLTYSVVYIVFAACLALPFIGVMLAATGKIETRLGIGIILTLVCSGMFLHLYPEMITGPYGGIDPQLYAILLDAVDEAKPLTHTAEGWKRVISYMLMSLSAIPVALYLTRKAQNDSRWKWLLISLFLLSSTALTIFYQYRFLGMSSAMAIIPLTAFAATLWPQINHTFKNRPKVFAEIGLLLFIGPLMSVVVPSLFDSRSFNKGFFLFPVDAGHTPCDMAKLEKVLRDPNQLGDHPHLIMNMEGNGPELLFRSEHSVLSAPFHMDVQGNLDATRFFATLYDHEAHNIARRRGVDLVIACRFVPDMYMAQVDKNGSKNQPLPLIAQLMRGMNPPWLEHISMPDIDNFLVYRIRAEQTPAPVSIKQRSKK